MHPRGWAIFFPEVHDCIIDIKIVLTEGSVMLGDTQVASGAAEQRAPSVLQQG